MTKEQYLYYISDNEYLLPFLGTDGFVPFDSKQGETYWVLGLIFLRHYYTIWDAPNGRVGLIETESTSYSDFNCSSILKSADEQDEGESASRSFLQSERPTF